MNARSGREGKAVVIAIAAVAWFLGSAPRVVVSRRNAPCGRIVEFRFLLAIAVPFGVAGAVLWNIGRPRGVRVRTFWKASWRVITDVTVDIEVHDILRADLEARECALELVPPRSTVQIENCANLAAGVM